MPRATPGLIAVPRSITTTLPFAFNPLNYWPNRPFSFRSNPLIVTTGGKFLPLRANFQSGIASVHEMHPPTTIKLDGPSKAVLPFWDRMCLYSTLNQIYRR